jgi:hypothetical protein
MLYLFNLLSYRFFIGAFLRAFFAGHHRILEGVVKILLFGALVYGFIYSFFFFFFSKEQKKKYLFGEFYFFFFFLNN